MQVHARLMQRTLGLYLGDMIFDQSALPPAIAGLLILAIIYRTVKWSHRLPLPPGPSGLPFVGVASQISQDQPWMTFTNWAKQYGEIMHLSMLGQSFIVLNSTEAVRELFVHRSAGYFNRPESYTVTTIMGFDKNPVFCSDRDVHREGRKLIINTIAGANLPDVNRLQQKKCVQFLSRLMNSPERFRLHIEWVIASVIFELTLGHDPKDETDPFLALVRAGSAEANDTVGTGAQLLDLFPPLRHVPLWLLGSYGKKIEKMRREGERARWEPWTAVQTQMSAGIVKPSFIADFMEKRPHASTEERNFYQQVSVTFWTAGIDTSISSIETFFLAMVMYPEVQKRAQAELDSVIGHNALPTFAYKQKLPYLTAVIKEVHRWKPVAPFALPRTSGQDVEYKGYLIPANSVVMPNNWAVLHDPVLYPDPFVFNPDRYLCKEEVSSELNPDPRAFTFGYGKRVCPGQSLAEDSLFIIASSVLASFDISKPIDANGRAIEQDVRYTGIAAIHPSTFECKITPREEMSQVITNALAD